MKDLVIHKFPFEVTGQNITMQLPEGFKVLSIQKQKKSYCMWIVLDPDGQKKEQTFVVIGTGIRIKYEDYSKLKYVSTIQEGEYVWHIYQKARPVPVPDQKVPEGAEEVNHDIVEKKLEVKDEDRDSTSEQTV